jgi:hypothetical protein
LPVPPGQLAARAEQELTEAAFRGVGIVVFRDDQAAWPQLIEALGLQFAGNEHAGHAKIAGSAVSAAMRLSIVDGVQLKLVDASSIGSFEGDGKIAAAVHPFGLGAAAVLGFDPTMAVSATDAAALVAGAVAYVAPETALSPRGVVAVEIDVTNQGASTTTRVRETLDPALQFVDALDGGTLGPAGFAEWQFAQDANATDSLVYLVRLPSIAGKFGTTTEVAAVTSSGVTVFGTYPLDLTMARGEAEILQDAQRLAQAIPAKGNDASRRSKIVSALAAVAANPGASAAEREDAISALLSAIDQAKGLRSVDPTPLRLDLDALLAAWEARP